MIKQNFKTITGTVYGMPLAAAITHLMHIDLKITSERCVAARKFQCQQMC